VRRRNNANDITVRTVPKMGRVQSLADGENCSYDEHEDYF